MISLVSSTDVPGAPGKPEASKINATEMTISWTPPQSDGGNPITGYIVERKETTSTKWIKVNKHPQRELTLLAKGLTERSEYQFRVCAHNKAGFGPFSEPSDVYMAKPPYGKLASYLFKSFICLFCTSELLFTKEI